MNTNLASLADLNKSQRDSIAKAVMQTCSLWQVSPQPQLCARGFSLLACRSINLERGQPAPAPRAVMPARHCRLTPAAAASEPPNHLPLSNA